MSKCLITGHKGYIGSKLFAQLKRMGHEVIGIDLNENGDLFELLKDKFYYDFKPEFIFHMACWPRVGYCLEKPVETMRNNTLGGSVVLDYAHKVGSVKRFIYSSSSSVVGNGSGPTSPYGLQKYTTELETGIYNKVYGLETVSLRYFNVYSEDQKSDGPYATAVCNWMQSLRDNKKPFITGDGEQRRDMVHRDDVVSANIFAMSYSGEFNGAVFDVGTGDNISLNEIREIVQNHHDVEFDYIESRPGDVMLTKAEVSKLKNLGWSSQIKITKGITKCFKRSFK